MDIVSNVILFSGLLAACIWDIRTKSIPVPVILVMAAAGGMIRILEGSLFSADSLFALLPGTFLFVISMISREQILGMGDSLLFLAMGMLLQPEMMIFSGLCAFLLAGIYGLFLITVIRKSGKTEIAFAPFLFCAVLFITVAEYVGG